MDLSCFKAYDLRGSVPEQLNPALAERIGRAYVEITGAKKSLLGTTFVSPVTKSPRRCALA